MLTPTSMLPFLINPAAGLNALSLGKKSGQPQQLWVLRSKPTLASTGNQQLKLLTRTHVVQWQKKTHPMLWSWKHFDDSRSTAESQRDLVVHHLDTPKIRKLLCFPNCRVGDPASVFYRQERACITNVDQQILAADNLPWYVTMSSRRLGTRESALEKSRCAAWEGSPTTAKCPSNLRQISNPLCQFSDRT